MMEHWFKSLFSKRYRCRRWASQNLYRYRADPRWLYIRRVRRVMQRPLTFNRVVGVTNCGVIRSINIPEFRAVTALELADDIPMN